MNNKIYIVKEETDMYHHNKLAIHEVRVSVSRFIILYLGC